MEQIQFLFGHISVQTCGSPKSYPSHEINRLSVRPQAPIWYEHGPCSASGWVWSCAAFVPVELLTENLALRQQLSVFKRRHPRPKLTAADRLFWLLARRLWSSWKGALILVNPETVVQWHRAGFRWYWSMLSRVRKTPGRKKISKEIRELIFKMVAENPNWGAPRVHGELLMVGFDVSERTVSRWMRRAPRDSEAAQRWRTFLHNHREAIAAVDFFAVPTVTFGLLYCFFYHCP